MKEGRTTRVGAFAPSPSLPRVGLGNSNEATFEGGVPEQRALDTCMFYWKDAFNQGQRNEFTEQLTCTQHMPKAALIKQTDTHTHVQITTIRLRPHLQTHHEENKKHSHTHELERPDLENAANAKSK